MKVFEQEPTIDQGQGAEAKLGLLIPDGKNIKPSIFFLMESKGIGMRDMKRNGTLHATLSDLPVTATVIPTESVIKQIAAGRFDVGFIGSDMLAEYNASLGPNRTPKVEELKGFEAFSPNLRLSLLVKDNGGIQTASHLRGMSLLTRFPILTEAFLKPIFPKDRKLPIRIDSDIPGKEEGMVQYGVYSATVVHVDTGGSMRTARLKELGGKEAATILSRIHLSFIYNRESIMDKGLNSQLEQFRDQLENGKRRRMAFSEMFGLQQLFNL